MVVVIVAPTVRIAIVTIPGIAVTVVIAPIVADRAVIQIGLYERSLVLAVSQRGVVPAIINNPSAEALLRTIVPSCVNVR